MGHIYSCFQKNVLHREVLSLGKFSALVLLERINWLFALVENLLSQTYLLLFLLAIQI